MALIRPALPRDPADPMSGTVNTLQGPPDPIAQALQPAGNTGPTPSAMPQGIDPALAAIYQKGNLNPADRGTGFADWQYWQGVGPSQYDRLTKDIAGTGTDQPTGTPGQGPWQSSGKSGQSPGMSSQLGQNPADAVMSQVEDTIRQYIMQAMQQGSGNAQA